MKSFNSKLFAALAAAWLMSLPAAGAALKIVTIEGAPWGFADSQGRPGGMMFEISNRIAEVAGLPYKNVLLPYPRTAFDIENGNADMVLRFANDHMNRVAVHVGIVTTMPIIAVGPHGVNYGSMDELHGKTVGIIRTSSYLPRFDHDPLIIKYAFNDYVAMARTLSLRRIDAGVGTEAGVYYGAYMAGIKREQLGAPLVLGSNDFIVFLSKQAARPETVQALQDALQKLKASGEIDAIISKYTRQIGVSGRR